MLFKACFAIHFNEYSHHSFHLCLKSYRFAFGSSLVCLFVPLEMKEEEKNAEANFLPDISHVFDLLFSFVNTIIVLPFSRNRRKKYICQSCKYVRWYVQIALFPFSVQSNFASF